MDDMMDNFSNALDVVKPLCLWIRKIPFPLDKGGPGETLVILFINFWNECLN
jgi:hypothetical protein